MSRFTHFFRRFFVTEKQTPQTFTLLECMPAGHDFDDGEEEKAAFNSQCKIEKHANLTGFLLINRKASLNLYHHWNLSTMTRLKLENL